MTIEIKETVLVHEAVIFRFMHLRSACRDGFVHDVVYCGTTLTRQANQGVAYFRRVSDLSWS